MSKLVLAAVGCAALLAAPQPTFAGPPATGPSGAGCGVLAVHDRRWTLDRVMTGVLFGGPIVASGELTCTVQEGHGLHSGPDSASASRSSGQLHMLLSPTSVSWTSTHGAPTYLCTQFDPGFGGDVRYWHAFEDPDGVPRSGDETPGHWTTDPNSSCAEATAFSPDGATSPVLGDLVDPLVCPTLASVLPPDGDIPGWDCPPYGGSGLNASFHGVFAAPPRVR